jgi:hypothetical protein
MGSCLTSSLHSLAYLHLLFRFGAVLEDFEIRDSIMGVLSGKGPQSSQLDTEWASSGVMEDVIADEN